ncbi:MULTISPECIES: hypothetical protein [unclassified Nocardioides]|uniref:hypothetical protein n=1 Tax=unclassified Nocardioides TaxID=2615069 RepID=UPI0011508756|nr:MULTISPECIES: hypothetical protein [unclassified Nocardioides]TQK72954.1 hypothetical protein FBY23_4775 [Nocardioides sp. SLBN-35]WGY02805.1 hypothetical protein QI633_03385 [Nocardioides sp. QY071]
MVRLLIAAAALLIALTGCSSDDPPLDTTPTRKSTPTATPTTPAPTTPAPTTPAPSTALPALVIRPGAIGDAQVGMTREEWAATGLFADGAAICEGELIHWKDDPDGAGLRVLTDEDATITQLWVTAPGPATEHGGIQVGSTYGDLKAAFSPLTKPVEDGYDQSSVYPPGEEDGLPYFGFLLDAPAAEVTDDTPISAIAVTGGEPAYFQFDC